MSTLTKVFVVLLAVFSIAFTMMTVSIVAQTTKWKDLAEQNERAAQVADSHVRNLHAANAALLASAADTINTKSGRIAVLEGDRQQLANRLAQTESVLAQAEMAKGAADAMSSGLVAQLKVANDASRMYREQRDDLERTGTDLTHRNIDLNERVNEQTAHIAVLLAEKRQFEQQIHIIRTDNERLAQEARRLSAGMTLEEASGAAMANVDALTPVAGTPIRGRVLDIAGSRVTLSIGSADGVKKDMVFVIHRDGQYIGDVKIGIVDPNRCAGRLVQSNEKPLVGDQATDALRLGSKDG